MPLYSGEATDRWYVPHKLVTQTDFDICDMTRLGVMDHDVVYSVHSKLLGTLFRLPISSKQSFLTPVPYYTKSKI